MDGNVEAATTLGRTKSHSKNALEWWDVDDDFEERREIAGELADVGKLKRQGSRMSPVSSFHKKVNSSARPSSPTLGLMKAKKTKKEQANEEAEARAKEARVQKSIAIAARLFGASKMRRGFIGDKVQLHDAQLKLQADVDALAKSQHALAMSMNEGLRAVAAGLKELAERQGGGAAGRAPSASVVEALESVIHARPHSPVGSLYSRPGAPLRHLTGRATRPCPSLWQQQCSRAKRRERRREATGVGRGGGGGGSDSATRLAQFQSARLGT